MAAAGALMQGVQGMQQGNYEAAVAKQNASIARDAAGDSITRGQKEAAQFYRQVGQTKGEQVAAMSANGIDVGSGTALTVQQDTQAGADEDAQSLYHNIDQRTRGYLISATNDMAAANAAKARGRNAMISGVFNAGQSAMGAFTQMQGLQAKFGVTRGDARGLFKSDPGAF